MFASGDYFSLLMAPSFVQKSVHLKLSSSPAGKEIPRVGTFYYKTAIAMMIRSQLLETKAIRDAAYVQGSKDLHLLPCLPE